MGTEPVTEVRVLQRNDCWERLRRAPFGRLAVVVWGKPEIFPVNHVVDGASLVFRTAAGTKLAGAAGRPVAFEVDGLDPESGEVWSVVVKGRAHEVTALEDVIAAMHLPLTPWTATTKPHFVRVPGDEVTGVAFDR